MENTIEPLKDGNLYAVVKKNSLANNVFEDSELGAIKLNELYLPHEDDTTLMKQALGIALDLSAAPLDSIHSSDFWCGFQKVKGHVRYRDFSTGGGGTVRPVRGMKVFALVFGIPVNTWTNNNGYYQVPWFFLFGTLVGTHAQNSKANIKPLTLNGNFLSNVGNIIVNFILGSRHIEGGFSACRMGNDINIEFHNHDQVRLWAQLIESVHLHHTYCAQDGIMPAPNNMTIYAQWGNSGRPSAPMLGHIQINPVSIMSKILGENLQSSAPNLFNLLFGVLPDMTITVDPNNHTTQGHVNRVETIFHELAHASLFRRVGSIWWTEAIANVVSWGNCPGYYGCIGDVHWGKTQVNESWAAYLGREHHKRLHPNASVQVRLITQQWALKSYTNNQALEEMVYFTENTWFHPGIFHDLRDNYSYLEDQDSLSGYSILSMYNAFNPHTNSLCSWRDQFHSNTLVNLSKLNSLMIKVNEWNQICH